jgi:hypothetical protein
MITCLAAAALLSCAAPAPTLIPVGERDWTMLVDFDGQPLWVASSDLRPGGKRKVRSAHILTIVLPGQDGTGEAGWIATVRDFDCSRGRSRVASVASAASDDRTLTVPEWDQPSREYEMVMPHTPQVTAMHAVCDGPGSGERVRVSGSPKDVYAYQAKLRRERLGF